MNRALFALGLLLVLTPMLFGGDLSDPDAGRHELLLADFAVFDRSYVPALALTNRGTLAACRPAMNRLKQAWEQLRDKHARSIPADPAWKSDFRKVENLIEQADELVVEGEQQEAHERLEGIREILLTARRRNGIEYYLDHLTVFHDTMEKIVKPAAVKVERGDFQVSQAERAEMERLLKQAKQEWQTVAQRPLPPGRFPVNPDALKKMVHAESQALDALQDALRQENAVKILQAAHAIKPPFARLFMSFGDFPQPVQ